MDRLQVVQGAMSNIVGILRQSRIYLRPRVHTCAGNNLIQKINQIINRHMEKWVQK